MEKEKEVESFIDSYAEKYSDLFMKATSSFWEAQNTGSKEAFEEYEKISNQIADFHSSKEDFEKTKEFLKLNEEPLIKRQLEIIHNAYLGYQGDKELIKKIISKEIEIEKNFNIFRAEIGEEKLTDNKIKEILKTSKNSDEVKEAWEASKKQGEIVEKDLLEVVKLRNQLARSLGFENYYVMSLKISEQDPDEIERIFEELSEKTEEPFRELKNEMDEFLSKKFDVLKEELKPWHYQDLFFQEGPEIYDLNLDDFYKKDILEMSKKFYNGIGMEVRNILDRSSLYEKEGKCQHAFAIDMDKKGDVRILQNIKNNEKWMGTTLHELGHAVYWLGINSELPFVLREVAHTFTTESIAMLFGRLSKNSSFVKEHSENLDESNLEILDNFWKTLKLSQLVTCRWYQVMVNFERELYKNPDQDLNKLWWSFVKKFQLVDFYRDKPDWASKIHFSNAPVYYHNYMLGELLASQLHNKITKDILKQSSLKNVNYSNNKEIGDFLKKEIFYPGLTYRWDVLVEKATGEKLTPKYFVEEFTE